METAIEKNTASISTFEFLNSVLHSVWQLYISYCYLGNWKKESTYVDHHGRQSINFHLSILLYTLLLCFIAIPIFVFTIFKNAPINAILNEDNFVLNGNDFTIENFSGIVVIAITAAFIFIMMKAAEFFLVIYATIKAANGELYKYPLTINFIKAEKTIIIENETPETSQA